MEHPSDSERCGTGPGALQTAADGTLASQVTQYQWDVNHRLPQLARESNGDGGLRRRYVHGLDTISLTTSGGTYYYHYDGLGSVTDVTDDTGAQQIEYGYEAFGDLRQHERAPGAPSNYFRYTGEYYDTFTETYHLRARQYDTHLGRFTQTDPAPAQMSDPYVADYIYVGNQPTLYVDPSGRFFEDPYDWLSLAASVVSLAVPAFTATAVAVELSFAAVDIVYALNDDEACDAEQVALIAVEAIVGLAGVSVALEGAGLTLASLGAFAVEQLVFEGLAPC